MGFQIPIIRQGASLPFVFTPGIDQSTDDFVCTIKVKQFAADTALIDRIITATNNVWSGFLTSTETDTLAAGITYRLFAILTKSSTDEEDQIQSRFHITADWGA